MQSMAAAKLAGSQGSGCILAHCMGLGESSVVWVLRTGGRDSN